MSAHGVRVICSSLSSLARKLPNSTKKKNGSRHNAFLLFIDRKQKLGLKRGSSKNAIIRFLERGQDVVAPP
jgi:hypothetical protein